ncbi:hypothetical protein BC827DRAFT_1268156 [Russula dissimulans]|nr:hypothetical protein BC827DRAFT_1268156 [Russula dissimulans]
MATERDYAVELNNFLQGHPTGDLTQFFHYAMTRDGPNHSVTHVAHAMFRGNSYGEGRGKKMGVAKREAAMHALEYFQVNGVPSPPPAA